MNLPVTRERLAVVQSESSCVEMKPKLKECEVMIIYVMMMMMTAFKYAIPEFLLFSFF